MGQLLFKEVVRFFVFEGEDLILVGDLLGSASIDTGTLFTFSILPLLAAVVEARICRIYEGRSRLLPKAVVIHPRHAAATS